MKFLLIHSLAIAIEQLFYLSDDGNVMAACPDQDDWSKLETVMQRNNLLLMMLHTNGMDLKQDLAILYNQYIII